MKKSSFTLLEVLISMLLLGFIIVASMQAYKFITTNYKINEIRYLALNKLDSEMNRLVFAYENLEETDFTFHDQDTEWAAGTAWNDWFDLNHSIGNAQPMKIYNLHPLQATVGLRIEGEWNGRVNVLRNVVEIINNNQSVNQVETGDVVGLMAWRVEHTPDEANPQSVHLSLTIQYPYIATLNVLDGNQVETSIKRLNGIEIEHLNVKTSTQVFQP